MTKEPLLPDSLLSTAEGAQLLGRPVQDLEAALARGDLLGEQAGRSREVRIRLRELLAWGQPMAEAPWSPASPPSGEPRAEALAPPDHLRGPDLLESRCAELLARLEASEQERRAQAAALLVTQRRLLELAAPGSSPRVPRPSWVLWGVVLVSVPALWIASLERAHGREMLRLEGEVSLVRGDLAQAVSASREREEGWAALAREQAESGREQAARFEGWRRESEAQFLQALAGEEAERHGLEARIEEVLQAGAEEREAAAERMRAAEDQAALLLAEQRQELSARIREQEDLLATAGATLQKQGDRQAALEADLYSLERKLEEARLEDALVRDRLATSEALLQAAQEEAARREVLLQARRSRLAAFAAGRIIQRAALVLAVIPTLRQGR